jgi:hypothetical protein
MKHRVDTTIDGIPVTFTGGPVNANQSHYPTAWLSPVFGEEYRKDYRGFIRRLHQEMIKQMAANGWQTNVAPNLARMACPDNWSPS